MPYYQDFASASLTHPVGTLVVPTADPLKFTASVVAPVQLVDGYVSCTSCHSTHFVDSDSTTPDGLGMPMNAGDGRLLRTDGPLVNGADLEDTANRRSAVCVACHPYKTHGNASEPLGCLVCHSAHVYTAVGTPNYFVLRKNVSTTAFGAKTGLEFTSLGLAQTTWADGVVDGANPNGYCEKCHGDLQTMAGSSRAHTEGENCRSCHVHNKAGALRSFEGSGCDGCHGSPPATTMAGGPSATGYAVDGPFNYSTSGVYKDETTTPHTSHSGAASGYNFACVYCHNDNFIATHDNGTFQSVLAPAGSFQSVVKPAGSGLNPAYTTTGNGSCASVGCHSNGGRRVDDATRVYTTTAPVWGGAKGSITTCDACHGNDGTDMVGKNSASHIDHLNAGYTCNICHNSTATSNTALTGSAAGTTHVNGLREVVFSGIAAGGNYTQASATCTVVCHGSATPDWDIAASGACGSCHQYSSAGVATGSGAALSATHNKHVYASGNGVQKTCDTCHTNNGPGTGTGHADGSISYVADYQNLACNPCHGANVTNSGNDLWPVWGNTSTVKCEICHLGALATISRQAPAKTNFATTGHGSVAAFNTANPVDPCKACHATTTTHFDGLANNNMLTGGAAANSAFCQTCHLSASFTIHNAAVNGSLAGDSCLICHESHGEGMGTNTGVMLAKGSGYTDGSTRASFANASGTGVCQTCHSSLVTHFNNVPTDETATHQGVGNCTSCHTHNKTPAFMYSAGTACNQCHGFPPATAAHAKHAASGSNNKDLEDRTDCEACHTGAASYTYSPSTDQGALLNHGDAAGRRAILASPQIGFTKGAGNVWTCTNACHISTTTDGFWYTWDDVGQPTQTVATRTPIDSNGLDCTSCHYYSAAPTSAGNVVNGKSEALGGDHSPHFGLGGVVTCDNCHVVPTDSTHISIPTGTDAQKYQDRAFAEQDEADVTAAALNTGSDADPGNATCNNVACHNPSNGAYTATWTVANVAGCAFCHSSTDPGTGSHNKHVNTFTNGFGLANIACTGCHVNNGTNNAHRNGTVTFAAGMGYTAGAEGVLGTVGTCTTTTCHNDGKATPTAVPTTNWGTPSADCTLCHGNAPDTGAHASHANATYVAGSCGDCHTAANVATHINGTRNMSSKVTDMDLVTVGNQLTAPGGWNGTCINSCHIANTANDWTPSGALACTDCHGSLKVTTPALDRGFPPTSGAHVAHVGNFYVAANCVNCHNDNTTTHSTLNNVVTAIGGTKVSGYTVNNCTNTCHVAADTNDWTVGTRACADCHMIGKTGLYDSGVRDQAPTSGLHATASALAHDDLFGASYTCTNCHNSATPSAAHGTGTLQTSLQTAYTYTAQIASYSNANGCASSCHKDGGTWNRKWIGVVDAAPLYTDLATAAVCKNCHGSFAQGWNYVNELGATTSDHTDPDADNVGDQMNAGGHAVCSKCHGWGDASYQSGLMHNNNLIAMNADLGYDNGTGNCATNCHSGMTLTTNTNSGFTNESGAFGGVGCGSCHDDGTIPPNSGAHAAHGANADADYSECILCHGNNGDNFATTTGTHGNLSVTFAVGITYSNNATAGTNALANDDTCSTTICHTSSGTVTWGATSLGCSECHYHNAAPTTAGNTGINALGGSHNKHFGTGGVTTCADCHVVPVAGDTAHINGATNLTDKANATMDEAAVIAAALNTGSDPDAGNATCNNIACHNPSNGAFTATWTVANAAGCAFCHSATDPGTGSHNKHVNTFTNGFGLANIACTGCHVNNGTNNAHRNGTVTFAAGMGYTAGAEGVLGTVGTCTTTTCHNDGLATPTAVPTTNWGTPSADCTLCHGNAPATGAHASHANATYVGGSCGDCHTAANVATHINGTRNMASKVTDMDLVTGGNQLTAPGGWNGTCINNCHIANTANDWAPAGTLACIDCHGSGKVTTPALDRGFPPTSGAHTSHVGNFYVAANCVDCHNNNTVTHSTLNNVVTLATGVKLTANPGNGSCTNTCHLAAQALDWTGGAAAVTCVDCHTSGKIGTVPTTGLHAGTLITSDNTHDDSFNDGVTAGAANCVSCHTSTPTTQVADHINGTFTSSWNAVAPSINFNSSVGFTDGTTPTCGPNGVGYVTCHDDGGAWKRKWSTTATINDDTRCANCHGDFDSGFVTGVGARHQTITTGDADGQIASGHDGSLNGKCSICHNYIKGDNTYYNIANFPVGQHRDGNIQINSNAGFTDYGAVVGCAKCHADNDGTADEGHSFADTTVRWTRSSVAGIPVTCGSCHGYPPDPLDGKPAISVEGKGAHAKHVTNIAAAEGVSLNTNTDTFTGATSQAVCGACHDVSVGANHSTGGGPRNLLIPAAKYQFGLSAPTYNGTVDQQSSIDAKNCSNTSCHFKTTPVWQ